MAIFRRKQQSSVLPEEVNQYYQSQRREKTGVVFFLGILALVATLLIGLGVFFGGRYLYQKIRGNETSPTTVQTTPATVTTQTPQLEISEAPNSSNVTSATPTPPAGTPAPSATTPTQTPALGDEPTTLPATGDEGH